MGAPAVAHVEDKGVEMGGNGHEGDEGGPSQANSGRLSWKLTICIWVLYIAEGVVMGVLYQRGEGRVVLIKNTP